MSTLAQVHRHEVLFIAFGNTSIHAGNDFPQHQPPPQIKPRGPNDMAGHTTTSSGQATPSYTQHLDDVLPSLVELYEPAPQSMCEFGDIMLVIEDGIHKQLKLQVNSCILTSTSKVFKTLLRGCFAEGEAIRSGTREVYMNDHPTPMLALCQLLHFKQVEPAVNISCLMDFTLLVDKFDCVEALKHATDGILGHFDPDFYCDPAKHDLIASAYILDQPTHFRRFTKALVRYSASHYHPDLDLQLQDFMIEHLPASFPASIIHQQSAVRNELVKCVTKIIDQFTTASYVKRKPNLVHQLMAAMKSKELWPILPVTSGSRSLEDQLASFASLDLPIISADRDTSYSSGRKRHSSIKSYDSYEDGYSLTPSPPPSRLPGSLGQRHGSSTSRSPTQRTVFDLSKRLQDLCVGLCLDCLKGNDVCRLAHPESWVAYQRSSEMWFSEETPREEPAPGVVWFTNQVAPLDDGGFAVGW